MSKLENGSVASIEDGKANPPTLYGVKKSPETVCLKRSLIGLSVVTVALFIACFVLIADLNQRVRTNKDDIDDVEQSQKSLGSPQEGGVILSTNVQPSASILTELYRGSGGWAGKPSLPFQASDVSSVACAGKIFVVGGLQSNGTVTGRAASFDPIFETHTNLAPLPNPRYRHGLACVSTDNSSYTLVVAGGFSSTAKGQNGEPEANVLEYSSDTGTWQNSSTLGVPRGDAAIAQVGTKVYLIGGYGLFYDMSASGTGVEILDTSVTPRAWTTGPNMPTSRGDIKAAVLGSDIYVVGGWNNGFKNNVEVLDTVALSWKIVAPLPLGRGDPAVAAIWGRIVVIGGEVWSGQRRACDFDPSIDCDVNEIPVHNVDQYDPKTNYWTSLSPLPEARFRFDASTANGAVFVFGGHRISNIEVDTVSALYLVDHPTVFLRNSTSA
mmetsp:Transcript_30661/g.74697  ORF Transcript_30661/g.74697 Transcript_30661/m.74697 type:complete len:439 (+) Transcript_30661:108-1424(+)|eukprot:CAMPEP_0114518966 /NCGR_PEP_ID=MMETSP0109-20121206/18734_1 /TAXON_ID=29199 /ORGANISM="Chlorarachnion reptans, Strain CCCM449" /LENGTH=438 /DNA_ID=CAMNT_0001699639 /DNA_START=83 /DNA_END=1399 /DNA_ORIENTATION=-